MSLTQPQIIPEGFCNAGTAGIDYVIPPVSSLNPDIVTQDKAYPVSQATPLNENGVAVNRPQTNGLWKLATDAIAFLNKGGNYTFDSALTGGYSKDAILWCASNNTFQRSLVNNNTANFITNPEYINDGINWASQGSNAANLVTAQLTPTFLTDEQYIISPVNFNGAVQQTIVLSRSVIDGTSTGAGSDSIEFIMTRNSSISALVINIQVISSTLSPSQYGFKSTTLSSPVTINGITIPSGAVVYAFYLKSTIPNNNTNNKIFGCYLSASQEFINSDINYPVLFEPVAAGTLVGTSSIIPFTTNATVEYVVDRYQDVIDNTTTGEVTIGGRIARSAQTMHSTDESGGFSQVRTSYTADGQGTQKPVFNATVSLPTGENAAFRLIPADVGGGYNGWYQSMQNFTSANIFGIVENYYINSSGKQLVGMYATNNGSSGNSISGVYAQSGIRAYLANTANLDKSNPESIAILNDITANGVGIVASGGSYLNGYIKFANNLIIAWGQHSANNGNIVNITYPISFNTPSSNSPNLSVSLTQGAPDPAFVLINSKGNNGFSCASYAASGLVATNPCAYSYIAIGY